MKACLLVSCYSNASFLENTHDVKSLSIVAILEKNKPSWLNKLVHCFHFLQIYTNVALYILKPALRLSKENSIFE